MSLAGFRAFLEKYEAMSQKDKADKRGRATSDEPMGYLGGLQFQTNTKDSRVLQKVIATDPQIMAGIPWTQGSDELDTTTVPVMVKPGMHGGSIRTVPNVDQASAFKKGRRVKDYGRRGHIRKRKDVDDLLSVGWQPAVAAAAGGGAAPAAPPM